MANIKGKSGSSVRFYFLGLQNSADSDCGAEIKIFAPWKESYDKPRQCIKKQRPFADQVLSSQSYGFSSSRVWMLVGP